MNHFWDRLGLADLCERFVPTKDRRCSLSYAKGMGVLVRSILVEREPIYRHYDTVNAAGPEILGLSREEARTLQDDQLGRAWDHLYQTDRGGLLTSIVVALAGAFGVCFDERHNDSSTGSTNDAITHTDTWDALRQATGRADFLYVADSKLCTYENMRHIDRQGGRLVTVMPRTRREDRWFRNWIQTQEPAWEPVWDRPHPRHMKREGMAEPALYPEHRPSKRPTAEQILPLFGRTDRHHLIQHGRVAQTFDPKLTDLQQQVLHLLQVPREAYRNAA